MQIYLLIFMLKNLILLISIYQNFVYLILLFKDLNHSKEIVKSMIFILEISLLKNTKKHYLSDYLITALIEK